MVGVRPTDNELAGNDVGSQTEQVSFGKAKLQDIFYHQNLFIRNQVFKLKINYSNRFLII